MGLFMRDSIIYKSKSVILFNNFKSNTPYEELKVNKFSENSLKITYTWFDPLKVRDKIIAKDQKTITIIYFKKQNILSCFGNSESQIGYVISRIEKILKINLEKVDIFSNYSAIINSELISIHIQETDFRTTELLESGIEEQVSLSLKDIPQNILTEYFNNGRVTLLTFRYCENNKLLTYFYVDKGSVVTFPDTVKEDVIYNVLEKAINIS
jgi:hypothetical protein